MTEAGGRGPRWLYSLLDPVGRRHAVLMIAFAPVGVPIAMLNRVNQAADLLPLGGVGGPAGFPAERLAGRAPG